MQYYKIRFCVCQFRSRQRRQGWHRRWRCLLQRPRRKITKKFLKKTVDFAKRRNLLIKTRNWTSKRVAESPDRFLFSLQTFWKCENKETFWHIDPSKGRVIRKNTTFYVLNFCTNYKSLYLCIVKKTEKHRVANSFHGFATFKLKSTGRQIVRNSKTGKRDPRSWRNC